MRRSGNRFPVPVAHETVGGRDLLRRHFFEQLMPIASIAALARCHSPQKFVEMKAVLPPVVVGAWIDALANSRRSSDEREIRLSYSHLLPDGVRLRVMRHLSQEESMCLLKAFVQELLVLYMQLRLNGLVVSETNDLFILSRSAGFRLRGVPD